MYGIEIPVNKVEERFLALTDAYKTKVYELTPDILKKILFDLPNAELQSLGLRRLEAEPPPGTQVYYENMISDLNKKVMALRDRLKAAEKLGKHIAKERDTAKEETRIARGEYAEVGTSWVLREDHERKVKTLQQKCDALEQRVREVSKLSISSPSVVCRKTGTQNCHVCDDIHCGDNMSPASRLYKAVDWWIKACGGRPGNFGNYATRAAIHAAWRDCNGRQPF